MGSDGNSMGKGVGLLLGRAVGARIISGQWEPLQGSVVSGSHCRVLTRVGS